MTQIIRFPEERVIIGSNGDDRGNRQRFITSNRPYVKCDKCMVFRDIMHYIQVNGLLSIFSGKEGSEDEFYVHNTIMEKCEDCIPGSLARYEKITNTVLDKVINFGTGYLNDAYKSLVKSSDISEWRREELLKIHV